MRENRDFNKVLNSKDVLITAFGAMIGWGWVVSSGNWIQTAGVLGTAIGFMIGGIMIYFVGLVYAELTTAMPECGGEHVFSEKAFGPVVSFICTWTVVLSYVGVVCFEACSFPTIIQYIFPGFMKGYLYTIAGFDVYASWLIVAVAAAVFITYVNIKGVKAAVVLQTILTVIIAGVGILLIIGSAFSGTFANLNHQLVVGEQASEILKSILSVAVIAPFFLFGFDVIPHAVEEINIPLRKLGKILILSIVLAVSFYAFVVVAVGYAMNPKEIAESVMSSGLVPADAMAKIFNSTLMAKILILGGMCGILTSWNSFLIGGSRALFSLAEAKRIPAGFAKLHKKYKTPVNALLLIGVLSGVSPFLGREMLIWISNVASFACCITYFIVSCSFLALRRKEPGMKRPFKVKHYNIVGILAILLSGLMIAVYMIPGTGCTLVVQEWCIAGGWAVLGAYFAYRSRAGYTE